MDEETHKFEITDEMDEELIEIKCEPDPEDNPLELPFHFVLPTIPSSSNVGPGLIPDSSSVTQIKTEFMKIDNEMESGQQTILSPAYTSTNPDMLNSFNVQPKIVAAYSVASGEMVTTQNESESCIGLSDDENLPGPSDHTSGGKKKHVGRDLLAKVCGVRGCGAVIIKKDNNETAIFRLPNNMNKRKLWLQQIQRMDLLHKPPHFMQICSRHFKPSDIVQTATGISLKRNAVPMLHLPSEVIKNDWDVGVQALPEMSDTRNQTDGTNMETKAVQVSFSEPKGLEIDSMKKLIAECKKRLRRLENGAHKTQKDAFDKWCDRFLPEHLAELVKGQATLKFGNKGNRYDYACKAFSLSWFYSSKEAYELLCKDLCLPHYSSLVRMDVPISTEYNEDIMTAFKYKVYNMSEQEKYCSVIVDLMKIRASLGYLTNKDKIAGLHEVNGCQSMEPAQYAMVIIVRGLLSNWSQPIAFALVSESKRHLQVSEWINIYLTKLLDIGLKVKTFVPTFKSEQLNEVETRQVSVEKPYFFINEVKIYYIFDVPDMLTELRDCFLEHNFHFQNGNGEGIASIKHIRDLLQHDLKNPLRLVPKLTQNHVQQKKSAKNQVRYAAQLLSRSVATALEMRIDFDKVDDGFGKYTVDFLLLINNLFDTLNSSSLNGQQFKKAFCGDNNQLNILQRSLKFFETLKVSKENQISQKEAVKPKISEGFQITIKSVLLLFQDLKQEGHNYLLTRNLHLGVSKKFFKTIKTKSDNMIVVPTCKVFIGHFRALFLNHILQPTKQKNCSRDLSKFLLNLNETEDTAQEETAKKIPFSNTPLAVLQSVSDAKALFANLKISLENYIGDICNVLLKGCLRHHSNCDRLKNFVDSFNMVFDSNENKELAIQTNTISPMYFVSFVEQMEKEFCAAFEAIERDSSVGLAVYEKIKDMEVATPCPCFPTKYLKALFIRLRIYMIVNYNSEIYRQNNYCGKNVVVPKILSLCV